jgi:cell wall assembly regulator SMI1
MPTIKEKVKETIARLEREVKDLAKREGETQVKLKPYPPATSEEIKLYEDYLELKLPESYRAFLELHNGYDWLVFPGHMLSIQSVMPGGKWFKKIQNWKKLSADYGTGEVLDGIIIANMGQPNDWAYIDPNQPTKTGEMAVIESQGSDDSRYSNLIKFFQSEIIFCRDYRTVRLPFLDDP